MQAIAGKESQRNITNQYIANHYAKLISKIKGDVKITYGTVEKGSTSEQSFTYVNKEFNSYATATSYWKILPESQKPYEKQDIKVFCKRLDLEGMNKFIVENNIAE